MKLLVLLLVLGIAYLLWRGKRVTRRRAADKPAQLAAPQDMLACAHCGVHVPRSEAWIRDGRSYCCAKHQTEHDA